MKIRALCLGLCVWGVLASVTQAQETAPPPAYLAVVEGNATLEREGEVVPAEQNMPFVQGDRLRTLDGRVQIMFPDGTAIEVAENSEVECISPTRVRLLAGTMDHVQRVINGGSQSAAHLPPELNVYGGTFDQYGAWQYDQPYGYVWYPTVAADWRPYYYGYWSPVPTYGYTWIGIDAWSWPTHHYGRWGFARNRWFWIPGRSWSAAWVTWASAPGYVSWCPLGFDGRPVFAFYGFGRSFAGWTILPRGSFGSHRYFANRFQIDPRRLPSTATFVAHNAPPRADRVGRTNVNTAPRTGIAVPRRQPPTAPAQPPAGNRAPTVNGALQSTAGARPNPVGRPATPDDAAASTDRLDARSPGIVRRPNVPTHYGIAPQPAATSPVTAGPSPVTASPTPVPSPAPYQPAVPGYRAPGEYRIPRVEPVAVPRGAPAAPSGPSPRVIGSPADRPFAPVGVPRTAPSVGGPGVVAPAQPGPGPAAAPVAAPVGAPAQARPAPQGEGRPQGGEGRAQGEGRARGRGRSQ